MLTFETNAQLAVSKVSDLDFGIAVQGEAEKTVTPNTVETSENASFLVSGPSSTSYSIILPRRIEMAHSSGVGKKIRVFNVISFPPEGANGFLDSSGQQFFYLGGTREAISPNLTTGIYSGSFTVEVIF